jgi:hypothetical protein
MINSIVPIINILSLISLFVILSMSYILRKSEND